MRRIERISLAAAIAVISGCGSSSPTTTVVQGSAATAQFSNPTAFFNKVPNSALLGGPTQILVLISDDPRGCADATGGVVDPGMGAQASRAEVINPGTQQVFPSLFLEMDEGKNVNDLDDVFTSHRTLGQSLHASVDRGCTPPIKVPLTDGGGDCVRLFGLDCSFDEWPDGGPAEGHPCETDVALSGSANFDGDSDTAAQGSFNLTFSDGSLAGTFNAQPCSSLTVTRGCGSAPGEVMPSLWLATLLAVVRRRRGSLQPNGFKL